MDLKVNYEKLNSVLSNLGLTFDDIEQEFTAPMPQKTWSHSHKEVSPHFFVPEVKKVYPRDIANGSYSENTPSLKAWFEYHFRNDTIMAHLGSDKVIPAIKQDSRVEFTSHDGKLFLFDDGNHRLFNYLLLYLMESKAAKTDKERKVIEEKFAIEKPIHFEHNSDAVEALRERERKKRSQLTALAKRYVEDHSKIAGGFGDYVEYDSKDKLYTTVINGAETRSIHEGDLERIVRGAPIFPNGVMLWESDGQYYAMCHNRVVKTKNIEVFKEYYKRCLTAENLIKKPENADKYIVEYDYDQNIYGVQVDSIMVDGNFTDDFKTRISQPYTSYIKNRTQLFHKMKSEDMRSVLDSCNSSMYGMVYIPERRYENLSEQECKAIIGEVEKEISIRQELEEGLKNNE